MSTPPVRGRPGAAAAGSIVGVHQQIAVVRRGTALEKGLRLQLQR